MQLTIGSQRLRSTDGIISIRGKRQISLEWGQLSSELLLTMNLYGAGGGHIARLRRNQWTFNDNERFDFAGNAGGFYLVDTKSSQVVLRARVEGRDSVVITQGSFYSFAGHEIEITMEDWNGVADARPSTEEPARHSTVPPYAPDEVASIRTSVASSNDTVECPRCGCPLTRERLASKAPRDSWLVSCMICRRNLVVHGQS
jgi:hypothetical protein